MDQASLSVLIKRLGMPKMPSVVNSHFEYLSMDFSLEGSCDYMLRLAPKTQSCDYDPGSTITLHPIELDMASLRGWRLLRPRL